jgi:hypothetical protein
VSEATELADRIKAWCATERERSHAAEAEALQVLAAFARDQRCHRCYLALSDMPTDYVDGRWVVPRPDGPEPLAVVTYASEESPETGHVGWVWWALGRMGEANSYPLAKHAAQERLLANERNLAEMAEEFPRTRAEWSARFPGIPVPDGGLYEAPAERDNDDSEEL